MKVSEVNGLLALHSFFGTDNNTVTPPVDLSRVLGMKRNASLEEIDEAYHAKMRPYRRAHRPDLFNHHHAAHMRMAYHDFERAARRAEIFMNSARTSRPNNTSHYYARSSVSTLNDDGVFRCRVIENVNGDVKEYEEESTDVHPLSSTNHVSSTVKRKHVRWKDME